MYQLFQINTGEIYDLFDSKINDRNKTVDISKLIWTKANNLCFSIQQRHEVAIKKAYVGFLEGENISFLMEMEFINTLKEGSQRADSKTKDLLIKKLDGKIADLLMKTNDFDWLIVAIECVEEINFNDSQNSRISHFMDLDFGTVCFDEELQSNVYQSYSCGDYDSGYYSSSVGEYDDPEYVNILKLQNNQKEIKKVVKKFNK